MADISLIWPRMDRSEAEERLGQLGETSGPELDLRLDHFSFTGVGQRADRRRIEALRNTVVEIATSHGFKLRHGFDQEVDPGNEGRAAFDTEVFSCLPEVMPMNWSEAGSREVWSWCAIAVLPDVTHWRWRWGRQNGRWNTERWMGSDLTRHTYGRQWWRSVQFASDPELVGSLREADFNQLTERTNSIGANPLLLSTFARRFLERVECGGVDRRELIRDSTQRLLREMYFIDDVALTECELVQWSDRILDVSARELSRGSNRISTTG